MSSKPSFSEASIGCIIVLLLIPVGMLLNAVAFVFLWDWFVRPMGTPEVGYVQAMGLSLLIGMFTSRRPVSESRDSDGTIWNAVAKAMGTTILTPLFILGIGWLIHLGM